MPQLPQRRVILTITLLADSDDRARAIIEAMTDEDGSVLASEIAEIRELPASAQTD